MYVLLWCLYVLLGKMYIEIITPSWDNLYHIETVQSKDYASSSVPALHVVFVSEVYLPFSATKTFAKFVAAIVPKVLSVLKET